MSLFLSKRKESVKHHPQEMKIMKLSKNQQCFGHCLFYLLYCWGMAPLLISAAFTGAALIREEALISDTTLIRGDVVNTEVKLYLK